LQPAIKLSKPSVKVIGVEPELQATRKRACVQEDSSTSRPSRFHAPSLMDSARKSLGSITFEHIRRYVDDILTVKENEICEAVKLLASNPNTVAEPSGAVAVAAFLFHRNELPNTTMNVAIISGGNIDPKLLGEICRDHAASCTSSISEAS